MIGERLRRGEHHDIPGAVRASFGIGTTVEHIDRLVDALCEISTRPPALRYEEEPSTGDFLPLTDRRTFPRFELLPPLESTGRGMACGQF